MEVAIVISAALISICMGICADHIVKAIREVKKGIK